MRCLVSKMETTQQYSKCDGSPNIRGDGWCCLSIDFSMCFSEHIQVVHNMQVEVSPLTGSPQTLPLLRPQKRWGEAPLVVSRKGRWEHYTWWVVLPFQNWKNDSGWVEYLDDFFVKKDTQRLWPIVLLSSSFSDLYFNQVTDSFTVPEGARVRTGYT